MATQTTTLPPSLLVAPRTTTTATASTGIRRYKDFLTSALHQRFRRASALIFLYCLALSIFQRFNWLSLTGIRAGLLFLPALAVFIIRVANLHTRAPVHATRAEELLSILTSWRTPHTLAWYIFSAWFFGELYVWSGTEGEGLGWVNKGKRYDERPVLNENPIFLRFVWFVLAAGQTYLHFRRDEDRVAIPVQDATQTTSGKTDPKEEGSVFLATLQQLWSRSWTITVRTFQLLIPTIPISMALYPLFMRRLLWTYFSTIGHLLFTNLLSNNGPGDLQHKWLLSWQMFSSSFTLVLLWELSNAIFSILVARPPLRYNAPLTTEAKDAHGKVLSRSRDPNGSLLTGLQSKKDVPQSFAFWELYLICIHFETRRKTIYTEVDRTNGSTWSQVSKLCLTEVNTMRTRIENSLRKPSPAPAQSNPASPPSSSSTNYAGMPKIATRQVEPNAAILASSSSSSSARVSKLARNMGQDPSGGKRIQASAKAALDWSSEHLRHPSPTSHPHLADAEKKFTSLTMAILSYISPGSLFTSTPARHLRLTVFSDAGADTIVHALLSLGMLCRNSFKEDDFGVVARDVAGIIRDLTAAVKALEALGRDVVPPVVDDEVEMVKKAVRAVLEMLVLDFGEYAVGLGVTLKEMREAREAVAGV